MNEGEEGLQDILPLPGDILDTIMSEGDIGKVGDGLEDLSGKPWWFLSEFFL